MASPTEGGAGRNGHARGRSADRQVAERLFPTVMPALAEMTSNERRGRVDLFRRRGRADPLVLDGIVVDLRIVDLDLEADLLGGQIADDGQDLIGRDGFVMLG